MAEESQAKPAVTNRESKVIATLVGALAHARKDANKLKGAKDALRAEQRASKASMKARRRAAAIADNAQRQKLALAKMHEPDLSEAKRRESRLKGEIAQLRHDIASVEVLRSELATIHGAIAAAGYVARHKIERIIGKPITPSDEVRPLVGVPGMDIVLAGCERTIVHAPTPEGWTENLQERRKSWLAQREEAEVLETARVEAIFKRREAIVAKTREIAKAEEQTADARKAAAEAHQNEIDRTRLLKKTADRDKRDALKAEEADMIAAVKAYIANQQKVMGIV